MSNDPLTMLNRLRGKAAKPTTQHNVPQIKTTDELAQQSQENGRWNENLLSVTKNLVREGRSDAEIHAVTDQLTTSDYTVQETRKQVQPMVDGARSKPFGKFHPNVANTYLVLTESERWAPVFAYDELNDQTMVIAKPPWQARNPKYFKPRPFIDTDYTHTLMWLQLNWANVSKKAVDDAVDAAKAAGSVLNAVSEGELTPIEATRVMGLIDSYRKTLELTEIEQRLQALENANS